MRTPDSKLSRRALLAGAAAVCSAAPSEKTSAGLTKIAIFSKHLQFVKDEALAGFAGDVGFDGIDITVRKGGHIAPERARQDLPRLVGIIRGKGLEVPMITTDIVDTESPFAEDIVKTMADLGIRHYRWGGFKYDRDGPTAGGLDRFKPRIAKLAELNSRHKVTAMYHTHSGVGLVGASIWDLYVLLKDFDPTAVGVNYDIGHATIEGGVGGWIQSYRINGAHVRGVAWKDCIWAKDAKGNWRTEWVPLGEGMVHLQQFAGMLRQSQFSGPLQLHFEYPLGNDPAKIAFAMKRDLQRMRSIIQASA